jgi:hypothetical protein
MAQLHRYHKRLRAQERRLRRIRHSRFVQNRIAGINYTQHFDRMYRRQQDRCNHVFMALRPANDKSGWRQVCVHCRLETS